MKQRQFLLVVGAGAVAFLSGCATDYTEYAKIETARWQSEEARWKGMADIAMTADPTTKTVAMVTMGMQGANTHAPSAAPRSAWDTALGFAQVLANPLTMIYQSHQNMLLGTTQSNNSTALGISTNQAFQGIAGNIQAPAANVTTTLSGAGVIGSGSTTDRHDTTSTITNDSHSVNTSDRHDTGLPETNPIKTPPPPPPPPPVPLP